MFENVDFQNIVISPNNLFQKGLGFRLEGVQDHPEKLSNFKPVSKAAKAMKIVPKATQIYEKLILESREIQFLQRLVFAKPLK